MIQSSQLIHNELLLFEDSIRPVRFWLEELSLDQPVQRKESSLWEELFCFAGMLSVDGMTSRTVISAFHLENGSHT